MPVSFPPGQTIADRYQVLDRLGRGGSGFTYQARDLETDTLVALKVLSLSQLEDWKQIELFDREANVLKQLNHPNIPAYLDHFQLDNDGDRLFYIVQQLAPGKSLATLIEDGWRPEEEEVKAIAARVLEILVYLQDLVPPVIHRDIKPQNIIYRRAREGDRSESDLFLVDFGAVRDTYHQTALGSTVVGTYGYMAPEQFRGQATLSTDLYGLATTLLFLLAGAPPSDLPERNLKLDFRGKVNISVRFADWIDKCIEPSADARFPHAEAAWEVLRGNKAIAAFSNDGQLRQPHYSAIELEKSKDKLVVTIPPALFRQRRDRRLAILGTVWHLLLLFLVIGVTSSTHLLWGGLYAIAFGTSITGLERFKKGSKLLRWLLLSYAFFTSGVSLAPFSINVTSIVSSAAIFLDTSYGDEKRRAWFGDLFTFAQLEIDEKTATVVLQISYPYFKKIGKKIVQHKSQFLDPSGLEPLRINQTSAASKLASYAYIGGLLTRAEKTWLWQEISNFLSD